MVDIFGNLGSMIEKEQPKTIKKNGFEWRKYITLTGCHANK
jgi:hypothetical protein